MKLNSQQEKEDFSKKSTYSVEEKKYIMEQLNAQRLKVQKKVEPKNKKYSAQRKKDILNEINDKRLEKQFYNDMEKRRIYNKKVYTFDLRYFYKFEHMDREYYMEVTDVQNLSNEAHIFTLYHKTFGELKMKDFLIKIELYSDKIFISDDVLRIYFKGYSLENEQ